MTAVTRWDDAILHALIMINSSIKLSLMSPHPLCTINTSSPRTDSPISTLQNNEVEMAFKTGYVTLFEYNITRGL